MKKYISFFTLVISFSAMQAQEVSDALRYSQNSPLGTARFRAMSGAFGALGGDLSAISVNPASSAVFANNQVAATANVNGTKNSSNYFGSKNSENNSSFDINQVGAVFIFENQKETTTWKKFSISINYENQNNFDNSLFSGGTNPFNSGTQYFVNYANGVKLSTLENYYYDELGFGDQQASLAYQSFLINPVDPLDPNNTLYNPNILATGNYNQTNSIESTGYNGKLTFNGAAQYQNWLYMGISFNSHFTDYRKSTVFTENYNGSIDADNTQGVQSFKFNNDLYTYGSGFSFQMGAIAKVTQSLRLGLAFESPTWMTLNDELKQSLSTVCADCPEPTYNEDPNITNIYAPYKLKTPGKWTGSLAYVFGKQGLISIDLSTKDYSTIKFSPQNEFTGLNRTMSNELTRSNEIRIGVEHKIKQWSLRAGYRNEGSPYKDKNMMGDLNGYSGGFGYNFGSTKLDFAYSATKRNYADQFLSQGMTDKAKVDAKNNNFMVTLAFEL